jgi:uncharacterized membrane protein YfcA
MQREGYNRRTMIIGIIISAIIGILLINYTDNPVLAIASGMVIALIMQRILRKPD